MIIVINFWIPNDFLHPFSKSSTDQTRLHSIQDEEFEELLVIVEENTPFFIMIFPVERIDRDARASDNRSLCIHSALPV